MLGFKFYTTHHSYVNSSNLLLYEGNNCFYLRSLLQQESSPFNTNELRKAILLQKEVEAKK
jgi:hypothetical protein